MLRLGLIGCGTHARWAVLPAVAAAGRFELVAAADVVAEHLDAIEAPNVGRYTDYRRMLAEENLDAVFVATPVEAHCEPTIAALQAGCGVLCEKPMATDEAECRRMTAAAEAAGMVLAVDFETRYAPANRQVRQWIADGHLGQVRAVHISHLWDGHKVFGPHSERRKGFLQRSGCLDCGIHMLDIARFYCGGGQWRRVRAMGSWFGEDVPHPPHIAISACLTPGVMVTLSASFAYTAYIKERATHEAKVIVGEKGVISLERDEHGRAGFRLVSETLTADFGFDYEGHADVIPRVLADFAAALDGQPPSPCLATGHDGLMAQIAMDAANHSAVQAGDTAACTE